MPIESCLLQGSFDDHADCFAVVDNKNFHGLVTLKSCFLDGVEFEIEMGVGLLLFEQQHACRLAIANKVDRQIGVWALQAAGTYAR